MSQLHHPNILELEDVVFSFQAPKGTVIEELETEESEAEELGNKELEVISVLILPVALSSLYDVNKKTLTIEDRKFIALQILRGAAYIQSNDILHGDYKEANILMYKCDEQYLIKIGDFGLANTHRCRQLSGNYNVFAPMYSPPEILLGGKYTMKGDIWALGVIMAQLLSDVSSYLSGDNERDRFYWIFRVFGTPTEETWPGVTTLPLYNPKFYLFKNTNPYQRLTGLIPGAKSILDKMLILDPSKRHDLFNIMNDPFFDDVRDKLLQPCFNASTITSINCGVYLLNSYIKIASPIRSEDITNEMVSILIDWIYQIKIAYKRFQIER